MTTFFNLISNIGFPASLARIPASWSRRLIHKRAIAYMSKLDDHLLTDIGLTRADLARLRTVHG